MSEQAESDADFGRVELEDNDSILSAADLDKVDKKMKPVEQPEVADVPDISDPRWSEYVMAQFEDHEKTDDGCPFVHGLRRVARKLIGPLLESSSHVVQAPSLLNGELTTLLQPAVVEHTVRFLNTQLEEGMTSAYEQTFTDAADVYVGNTDPDFARHATATAATRAEARALRKALQLGRVLAAEEKTLVPLGEAGVDGKITDNQIMFLNVLCKRNDVNVLKYISSGKKKYAKIEDVPYGVAVKMSEHLSGLQNDQSKIPDNVKGYDPEWRS